MKRERIGQVLFLAATAVAAVIYGLTVPNGLPWNGSTALALAYLGEITQLPDMGHSVWGRYVEVFGGAVTLAVCMAALAAGLLGALVNRYCGWRFAAAAATVWIFLPAVWNRAITGERGICVAALAVTAAWALNATFLWVTKRVREMKKAGVAQSPAAQMATTHDASKQRAKVNRIASWAVLGAAGIFAVVSASMHDYRLGEAASVFAKGVVSAADGRIIVLNGVCDAQIVREVGSGNEEVKSKSEKGKSKGERAEGLAFVSLRTDDEYRRELTAAVKREWPNETNFWVAAQVGASAFVEVAAKKFPNWFYLMNGQSTTAEAWEKRWAAFAPYLDSDDAFVPVGRRLFGYEANAVANALQGSDEKAAWKLYRRIYEEIDPGNFSALVNMGEMIRRGHTVGAEEKKKVQGELDKVFKDVRKLRHLREIARSCGPVKADPNVVAKLEEEAKKRIAERIAAGEKIEVAPEIMSLVEWNNEMVRAMNGGDLVRGGRLARKILSNPKWHGFIPANAVMGSVAAKEGDYVASAAFFRTATDTTNSVPAVVLNDYADTLMHLGKLEEAERTVRRAMAETDEKFWLARLTLAELLVKKATAHKRVEVVENGERTLEFVPTADKAKVNAEIRELLASVMRYAPEAVREQARKMLREIGK